MGNSISKYTGGKGAHPQITEDDVENVAATLRQHIKGQDEAVAAIVHWLEALNADTNDNLFGSVCFAGAQVEAIGQCLDVLSTVLFKKNSYCEIDMKMYSHKGCATSLLNTIKEAHGNKIIVFRNIIHSHPEASLTLNHLFYRRNITPITSSQILPNQIPFMERLSYNNVLFVVVHEPPIFSSQPMSTKLICSKTRSILAKGVNIFDEIVPFIKIERDEETEIMVGGSSRGREDMRPSKAGKNKLLSKRGAPETPSTPTPLTKSPAQKRMKHSHNTNITMNSHNPSDSNNPTTDSNNNTTESPTTFGNENTTNSHNTTSTIPLTIANSNITYSKHSQSEKKETTPELVVKQPFPIRQNTSVEPYVDGEAYFGRLFDVLSNAKKEILICGWQLSQIYLKRPYNSNLESDILMVLNRAAARQVAVYLMLRNHDSGKVAGNKHQEYKSVLEQLSPNVNVSLQHRKGKVKSILFSHHQKFVVVDRKIAFVGGLDLALSRWDTQQHPIVDLEGHLFPDEDYYHFGDDIDRNTHPRMGWHDVQISVEGTIVGDLRLAFMQRWNSHNDKTKQILPVPFTPSVPRRSSVNCTTQVVRSISGDSIGKNDHYVERNVMRAYVDLVTSAQSFVYIENQYFLEQKPMELMNAICGRIIRAKKERQQFLVAVFLPIIPDNGSLDGFVNSFFKIVQTILTMQRETVEYVTATLAANGIVAQNYIRFYTLMQHAKLGDKAVAAPIYIHSKLMITDSKAIIGSGNINHRSTSGKSDSEIGVVVDSPEFCKQLVKQLLSEHAGIPCSDNICEFMTHDLDTTAAINSNTYERIFNYMGAKKVKGFLQSRQLSGNDDRGELQKIRGHVVKLLPSDFLERDTQPSPLMKHINIIRYGCR